MWTEWWIDSIITCCSCCSALFVAVVVMVGVLYGTTCTVRYVRIWQMAKREIKPKARHSKKKRQLNMCLMFSTNVVRNYSFVSLNWLAGRYFFRFVHSIWFFFPLVDFCSAHSAAQKRRPCVHILDFGRSWPRIFAVVVATVAERALVAV